MAAATRAAVIGIIAAELTQCSVSSTDMQSKVRHGLSDGSISRRRAAIFYRELESIRREAYRSERYGNYQHGYIQARMAQLHQRMHLKHERGHDRNDGYGYNYGNYGGYQQGYARPSRGHDEDDGHHDEDD